MQSSRRLQINSRIVHETIHGEVVAIDMESGTYYSLASVAGEVWALLEQPSTLAELTSILETRYQADPGQIETALATFLGSLESESLIVEAGTGESRPAVPQIDDKLGGRSFVPPTLDKYSDMQDLLKIDPIHEVGNAGWPIRKNGDE